jgi:hypothetical protein
MNAKDRALQSHLVRAVLAAQATVAPELLDLIGGSTPEEIDRSVERVKTTTAQLVSRVRQEAARPSDTDPAWLHNPAQGYGDIDLADYARLRMQPGMPGAWRDHGIFGPITN